MVYFAGDNDLSEEFIWATKEMIHVGVNEKVTVIIQLDTRGADAVARRYILSSEHQILNTGQDGGLEEQGIWLKLASDETDINSASPEVLKAFIADSLQRYPAEHYMLVLAGHGAGAFGDNLMKDDNPPAFLTIQGLKWALEESTKVIGKPLDILGMDSCLMSSIEVGYEIKNSARFFI